MRCWRGKVDVAPRASEFVRRVLERRGLSRSNDSMGDDTRPFGGDSFWRELVGASKVPFAIVGGVVVVGLVWALWPPPPDHSLDLAGLVEPTPPAELVLDAGAVGGLATHTLIAAERIVVKGVVELPSERVVVANEIVFEPESRLMVPSGHVTVLAPRMTGAVIEVSGRPGADGKEAGAAGARGEAGGTIVVASAEVADARLVANGGAGGSGQRGYAGAAGQRGYCGPNGFRLAEPGKEGGDGGAGAQGAAGGLVMVLYRYDAPNADAAAGRPGAGAAGGAGGKGGAGCKGVRGSQKTQPPGNDGAPGRSGSRAPNGSVTVRRVEFSNVLHAFDEWRDNPEENAEKLRDRLRTIATYEP